MYLHADEVDATFSFFSGECAAGSRIIFDYFPSAIVEGTHNKKPVGTGPFKYYKWNAGDHFIVLKNDRYWQPMKPFLDKVVFRTIPDHQTRYASLISGQIDAIMLDRGNLIQKAKDDPVQLVLHETARHPNE